MTNTAALIAGAPADIVLGFIAVATILRASIRATGAARTAYAVMAVGLGFGALSLAATIVWVEFDGIHLRPLLPFVIGLSLQAISLLIAVARMATIVDGPGALARRGAEAMVIASCAAYALWTLLISPLRLQFFGTTAGLGDKTVGLVVLAPSAIALCFCATVSWRSRHASPGPMVARILATIAGAPLLLLAAAANRPAVTIAAVFFYGACIIATVLRVRRAEPLVEVAPQRSGTLIGWLPVSVAITACGIHLAIFHRADNTSILIATVIGAALAGRQTLIVRDLRAAAAEVARREARYKGLAHTDALTGLANRRALVAALAEQVIGGPPSVLLMVDLDGFKNINDLRGHDIGDEVLIEVARRLRANLRTGDIAARLGGDEFAVVLWLQPDEALSAADRLRAVLARPYDVAGTAGVYLSASIGVAPCLGAADVAGLMRSADLALRYAKLRGKDRVEGYAEAFAQWLRRRTLVETELRGALERSELTLLYQPVIGLPAGTVVGAEAQVRWHHPSLGLVPPAEFLPIAEDSGLIHEMGRWLLAETSRQLARWIADGLQLWVGANVSVRELHRPDYRDQVADAVRTYRLPAGRLILEVTEHAFALDSEELVAT
ncbi:MAG TPA: diguanylate cyclase, partial [Micromonosporaceae bacterium]